MQEEEPFRVHIVAADERIPKFYMAVLEHADMQAMAMSDPMKVLDAISDFRPELVLMDQYIPEIEGQDARYRHPSRSRIPIHLDYIPFGQK